MVTETIDLGEIGKNIESWNTDPDGKGTRYAVIGETVVTFTPKDGENVRIKATNENDAAVPPDTNILLKRLIIYRRCCIMNMVMRNEKIHFHA